MADDPGGYAEAREVLDRARAMFSDHSRAITGYTWDWATLDEQIKTIWIIKALRDKPKEG